MIEKREFTLTSGLVDSLISLLNLPNNSKVLIIEFGTQISSDMNLEEHTAIHIQNNENLQEQKKRIEENGPYDGAIVVSDFSWTPAHLVPPEGWETLRHPTTEDWLVANALNNLKPSGSLTALVPNGLLSNYGRQAMRKGLVDRGLTLVAKIPHDLLYGNFNQVLISEALILLKLDNTSSTRHITFVDWANYFELPDKESWQNIISGQLNILYDIVHIPVLDLKQGYRLDPPYYDPTYLQIEPPQGYIEVSLSEIAEIRGGFMVKGEDRSETKMTEEALPYLQVRHIQNSGIISEKVFWVEPSKVSDSEARLAVPGDILVSVSGTIGKVAIVPESYSKGVFFDTSIRRVRVDKVYATPNEIFEFLQSEIGQLQFRRFTSGSAIPQLTTPDFAAMRIFLLGSQGDVATAPAEEPKRVDIAGNQTQASVFANAIQEKVVDYLRNIESNDSSWNETIEKTLSNLTKNLIPKPLEKLILEDFPTPIAIPYRRFNMARYNPYERLDRMVTLVESCVYFVFHVLVVDYCKHGWKSQITLSSEAKSALKGTQSIGFRLKFIDEVLGFARTGYVSLFMSELANTEITIIGDQLRNEVRNPIAHSAPGSEPYVRSMVDKYLPGITKLLESLRFLDNYTLCRIRSHYYQNGRWRYQAEVYRGAEYDLNIQDSSFTDDTGESQLIEAERDHLIILSPDAETLDMHPFYQLYFGDETARESHLCFFKHRQSNRLVGESIRSSVEITLFGVEDFQSLTGVNIGNNAQES